MMSLGDVKKSVSSNALCDVQLRPLRETATNRPAIVGPARQKFPPRRTKTGGRWPARLPNRQAARGGRQYVHLQSNRARAYAKNALPLGARARAASPRESRRAPGPLCDARGLQGAAGLPRGGRGKGRPQRLPRCPGRALPARAQRPPLTARGPRAKGKPPKARGPSNARPPFAGARRSAPARTACDS